MSLIGKLKDIYRPIYTKGKVGDKVIYLGITFPENQVLWNLSNYFKKAVPCTVIALDGNQESHSITLRYPNGKQFTTGFPNPYIRKPSLLESLLTF